MFLSETSQEKSEKFQTKQRDCTFLSLMQEVTVLDDHVQIFLNIDWPV